MTCIGAFDTDAIEVPLPDMMLTEASFGMGRVVTQTVSVIRRNILPIVLLCCAVHVAQTAVSYLLDGAASWLFPELRPWSVRPLSVAIGFALQAVLTGGIIYTVVEDLDGRPARLGAAALFGARMTIPVVLLTLLVSVSGAVGSLLIAPGLMLVMRWFVAVPVRIIEGPGFRRVLSRSAALTKGYRWKLLALWVAYYALVSVLTYLSGFLVKAFAGQDTWLAGFNPGAYLTAMVLAVITNSIHTAGTATVYGELRRVRDGGLPNQLAAVFE